MWLDLSSHDNCSQLSQGPACSTHSSPEPCSLVSIYMCHFHPDPYFRMYHFQHDHLLLAPHPHFLAGMSYVSWVKCFSSAHVRQSRHIFFRSVIKPCWIRYCTAERLKCGFKVQMGESVADSCRRQPQLFLKWCTVDWLLDNMAERHKESTAIFCIISGYCRHTEFSVTVKFKLGMLSNVKTTGKYEHFVCAYQTIRHLRSGPGLLSKINDKIHAC